MKNIKEEITKLRDSGLSYRKIAKLVGVSPQRIHQILTGYVSPSNKPAHYTTFMVGTNGNIYDSSGIKLEGRDFLKEIVRRRDGYVCQSCKKSWKKGERKLDVHHMDADLGGEAGRIYCNCKDLDRMVTLCHKCHLNLKHIREKMSKNNKGRKIKTQ